MLCFARLGCLWSVWRLCGVPGLAEIGTHACEERPPHFLVVQFATVGADTRRVWGLGGCCCFASTLLGVGRRIFSVFSSLRHTAWVITTPDSESYHERTRRGSPVTPHCEKWEELEFGGQTAPAQPIWWPCNNKSLRFQI